MTEQDEQAGGEIRRFGRKDRKRRLDPRGPLIPPDFDLPDEPDIPAESVVEAAPLEAPKVISPPAERFPPLDPTPPAEPPADAQPAARSWRKSPPRFPCLYNGIAVLFLVATVAVIVVYAVIIANPYTALNPFPPFTPVPIIITTTPLPPTVTSTPTPGPTASFTPLPLAVATRSPFPFELSGEVQYVANTNGEGCNWSSIAGRVIDRAGTPLDGYGVHIVGEGIDQTVFTGSSQTFGAGGYELFLNGTARDARYTVQLLSPTGDVQSAEYAVLTLAACDQNVTLVNFSETPSS